MLVVNVSKEPSAEAARPRRRGQSWSFWLLFVAVVAVLLVLLVRGVLATSASRLPAPHLQQVTLQQVTLPAGETVQGSLRIIAGATGISLKSLRLAADTPEHLDLPAYAHGHLEGLLFPATYSIVPGSSAEQVLRMMVDRFEAAAQGLGLERRAHALERSPFEVVTTASLVEKETTSKLEQSRVTRVIYNRLDARMPLQLDSTLAYVRQNETTEARRRDLRFESSYNTYRYRGLPPTPIGSPGLAALEAALSPATGDYLYFSIGKGVRDSLFTASVQEYLRARRLAPRETGSVTDVLDGDSILVRIDGRTEEVRLIGVDAPERGECFYGQTRAATTKWLDGKRVTVRFEEKQGMSDGYRLFAYVYVKKKLINLQLIRLGYARERAYGHEYKLRTGFRESQRKPWRKGSRVWGCP